MRKRAFWLSVAAMLVAPSAWAWKPFTHVYLAQQAWEDAVDDGRVTIYKVDKTTGVLAKDASGKPVVLGTYAVDPTVLRAIKNSPAKFFAGVLGPDAYPDILTGQMRIHPPGPGNGDPDVDTSGPGTDAWLQQLWIRAWQSGSDDAIAFATGFLSHAAGDIYAHTFMNTFAGGIFDIKDMSTFNWFKHITVEGYVGERTPELAPLSPARRIGNKLIEGPLVYDAVRDTGITGLEDFIAQNTWDIRDANGSRFPTESGKNVSVPYQLGTFLDTITQVNMQVKAYDASVWADVAHAAFNASLDTTAREVVWACGGSDCPDSSFTASTCPSEYLKGDDVCLGMAFGGAAAWSAAWAAVAALDGTYYTAEHAAASLVEGWTDNAISTTPVAMRDWVTASHSTAIHLFFTSDHLMHMDGDEFPGDQTLSDGYTQFEYDLESIVSGLNKGSIQTINDLIDFIMTPVNTIKGAIGDVTKWVKEQVFQAVLHMTTDQAKQCFAKPHMWLNPLLKSNTKGQGATLASMNAIMRLPSITPATCTNPTAQCTLSPSLAGADVTGACDILAGGQIAKFSVRPEDGPERVFPAAFNAVNMIKLSLMSAGDVQTLAASVAGKPLTLAPLSGAGPAPQNAMLGFAASIDGSHEWLAQRNGGSFGSTPMILAQSCDAYWSVFVDQRPDFDASVKALAGASRPEPLLLPQADRPWEPGPMALCKGPPPILQLPPNVSAQLNGNLSLGGFTTVTTSEPVTFSLASTGKNSYESPLTKGTVVAAPDGKSARYYPPKWNPLARDQIIVTSRDGARQAFVPVKLDAPKLAGFRRDLPRSPVPGKTGDPLGLRAGETAQLVPLGKLPMTWTVVSGPGTIGDAKLEATHAATLAQQKGSLTATELQLAQSAPKIADPKCMGACRAQALDGVRKAARARTTAVLAGALAKRQLEAARATYRAPDTITKDETVTLKGVDAEGNTAIVRVRVLAPPRPLVAKPAAASVQSGKPLRLDVDAGLPAGKRPAPPVPITWAVVSGPGTVGDPQNPERAKLVAEKQAFLASLQPLAKRLVEARPFEAAAARKAWLDQVQASVPKVAASFAKLDEIDRTYHAPAKVATKQRVVVRGTAQDGSGRTVDVAFDVEP
jgi:hypothetical protein